LVRVFSRARRSYSVDVTSATIRHPNGEELPFSASFLRAARPLRVTAGRQIAPKASVARQFLIAVERDIEVPRASGAGEPQVALSDSTPRLTAGTRIRVLTLEGVTASKSRDGDIVYARTVAPVQADDSVAVPEGALFEGRVVGIRRPRRLLRPGRVRVSFHRLILPDGKSVEISAVPGAVDADRKANLRLDLEGTVSAGPHSKKALVLNAAVAYGLGKLADDILEESVTAALGAAVSGTATAAARYVGLGVGLAFFLSRRGADVELPKYTELELTLNRDVRLHREAP
jgi:hypothetical protein